MVYGNAAVGGIGVGQVTVGESADDNALFALIGTLAIGGTGQLTLGGANATVRGGVIDIASGGLVSGAGTISGAAGGNNTATLASIDNDGMIRASGGNLLLYGGVTGTGSLSVAAGATLTLQAAVGAGQTLAFSAHARAVLNDARAFAGTIAGFGAGDVLEVAGTTASSATWSNGVLTLDSAFGPIRLNLAGNYVGDFVAVRSTEAAHPWLVEIRTEAANGAASITTGLAAMLGDARVTFAAGRANPVYVDGAPDSQLQIGASQTFADGMLSRLSAAAYRLTWNTGETVTVAERAGYDHGYLDWAVGLGAQDGPGSVQGLLGSNSGQATDFQLPDGSVLAQPLSDEEILGRFADAWRVAPGGSLFDDSAPAAPGTAFSPALLLQYMSAMGDATAGGASHDLGATFRGAVSADPFFAAATPSSPLHG
jgi:hypothetical protein